MRRNSLAFHVTAVLTLALGIGANTAIFTVVNAVLLRPLPFHDPGRLIAIWDTYQPNYPKLGISPAEYDQWIRQTDLFESVGRYRYVAVGKEMNLTGAGGPLRVQPTCVSSSLLLTLGIRPILGRAFQAADDGPNAPAIAMLSYRLWQNYFQANPNVIGAPIDLNGQAFTVVGVLPPDVRLPSWAELWLPQGQAGDEITNPLRHAFAVIARLRPEASMSQTRARLESIAARLAVDHPKTSRGIGLNIVTLQQDMAGNIRPALLMLFGAVSLVLLIACVNVANLLLCRAATRQREMAIRIALGAGRWRIVRDSLYESLRISLAGGAAGLLFGYGLLNLLLRLLPADSLDPSTIHIDLRTLAFLLSVSIVTGVAFGIVPALQAARQDPNMSLKEGGRSLSGGVSGRNALAIAEFSLALVLLLGAGLLIQSFSRMLHVNPGFRPSNVLSLRVSVSPENKPRAFFERLSTRLRALPGVREVAAANAIPLGGDRGNSTRFVVPGSPLMRPDVYPVAQIHLITPEYFRALGIPIRGRAYNARDLDQPLVIVNETMAKAFWPGEDAVGKRFVVGPWGPDASWSTVIGVAGDVKQFGLDSERTNDFYFLSYNQRYLFIQSSSDPLNLAAAVRREIREIDANVPVSDFRSMAQVLDASAGSRRFSTAVLAIFAAVALALALIGIYGIMSWSVTERTQEIGIRMAVGADSRRIFALILGYGLRLSLIGLALGLAATFALTRVLQSLLFEISPHDPWILSGISVAMVAVTLAACYLPAWRAARVDPITTLRA